MPLAPFLLTRVAFANFAAMSYLFSLPHSYIHTYAHIHANIHKYFYNERHARLSRVNAAMRSLSDAFPRD